MFRSVVLLAAGALACSDNATGGSSGCDSNAECEAGSVCIATVCTPLCSSDLSCGAGEACIDDTCKPCVDCRQTPEIQAVEGTGSGSPARLRGSLVLVGDNLEGVAVTLSGPGHPATTLLPCGAGTPERAEVALPDDVQEGMYQLTATNQAGNCAVQVQLLRGEDGAPGADGAVGPAGTYTTGPGITLTGDQLAVDFGSGAAQAAAGNHGHANYLATGGGTLSGDLTLAPGSRLGIGAQSPPALLHVVGGRAAHINNDPASTMLTSSGLVIASAATIVDNDTGTSGFHSDTAPAGSWLQIDLGAGGAREYVQVRIFAQSAGYAGRYDVEHSDNGSAWTKVRLGFIPSSQGWNGAAWAPAGAHRYWRLYLANAPGGGPWLQELELYELGSGAALSVADDGVVRAAAVEALNLPRAWVSFNGATMAVLDSYGVSSVTRSAGQATGVYKVTWSRPFADSNYVVTGACNALGYSGAYLTVEDNATAETRVDATYIGIGCRDTNNAWINSNRIYLVAYGRQ